MALHYNQWSSKTWKVRDKTATVLDLDERDEIRFSLSGSTIKITSFTCASHSPAHDAMEWKDRNCSGVASNKVAGTTFSGRDFEIVSSEEIDAKGNKRNLLTCRVILAPPVTELLMVKPADICDSTAGGVCWTAEDG